MPFTRNQDLLLTCRDQKWGKTFSTVGNRTHHEKKFGHALTITVKRERLLYDKTAKLYKCPKKERSSRSIYKRSIQRHLKECCYNYTDRAEAVARKKVCDYCEMTFRKKFNRDRHVQHVHKSDIADSILNIWDKSSASDFENTERNILEISF